MAFVRRIVTNLNLAGSPPNGSASTADEILFSTITPHTIYAELVKYNRVHFDWEKIPAGAVLFWKGVKNKEGNVSPGHVAICSKEGIDPLIITTPWTNGASQSVSEMPLSKIKEILRTPNGWMTPMPGWTSK